MAEDSLLREVDDAVRHDQMMALWRQYRKPLFAAALGLIIATAGASIWRDYKEKRAGQSMQGFSAAQTLYAQGKFADAASGFAATADQAMDHDVADMAHLWQARALEKSGKPDDAAKLLAEIANHPKGSDQIWSDLACLRLAGLDESKASCLSNGPSPMKPERDLLRAATLWQNGEAAKAAALLKTLTEDPGAPESLRTRAQHYLSVMKTDEKK